MITPGLPEAIKLGIETPAGAVITSVNPGSPAEKAGMAHGDVVAFFDGLEIDTPEDLEALIIQADVGSRHTVRLNSFTKFLTYDTELTIEQDQRDREDHSEYAHPQLGCSLRFPRDWKLDPYAKRHESSGKVYDSIKSPHGNYELHFYHDARSVEEKDTTLSQFISEAQKSFGDYHIGRVALGKIPVAFVAGPVGEMERKILFRIAMVVEDRLCEIDVLAHPLAAFESLPRAVSGILGTMNGQSRNR